MDKTKNKARTMKPEQAKPEPSKILKLHGGRVRFRKELVTKAAARADGKRWVITVYTKDQKEPTVLYYHGEKLFKVDCETVAEFLPQSAG